MTGTFLKILEHLGNLGGLERPVHILPNEVSRNIEILQKFLGVSKIPSSVWKRLKKPQI